MVNFLYICEIGVKRFFKVGMVKNFYNQRKIVYKILQKSEGKFKQKSVVM